ncbi:MAG: bifunctional 3-(3-hydroxy-phenyl)propionate/3-hydroxycinnamic acid hydroxylase [Variovorax sp.]
MHGDTRPTHSGDIGGSADLADVAIVGYGPVGQALALRLAQHGHRVVVVERWPALFGLPRAVGLDHEALRTLQALGIMAEFEPRTSLSKVYEWRNAAGEVLLAFPGLHEMGISGWSKGAGFSQPVLERILDERVRNEHAGQVRLMQGRAVVGLQERPGHVVLETRRGAGPEGEGQVERIAARYVVGCDGAGSFVRGALGTAMEDLAFAADWLVVDLQPRDASQCNDDLIQVCDPRRPTTMVSGGPGRCRFEFMMLEGERKEDFNNAAAAWSLLAPLGWNPSNAVLERHTVYTFRAAVAQTWRRGRLMIAGDAAHMTPPFAAQGLCAGLRDVASLAWRLDMVLRGRASEALLDGYSDERRVHARALVEFAVELGKIICLLDPVAAEARDRQLREAREARKEEQDGMPAPRLGDSPLLRAGDPQAGSLSVQGRIRCFGRIGRFDDLIGNGFVLIGDGHDPASRLGSAQRAFLHELGIRNIGVGPSCSAQDVDGTYRRWFDTLQCSAVLVRPDFYVYGAGEADELVGALMASWAEAYARREEALA